MQVRGSLCAPLLASLGAPLLVLGWFPSHLYGVAAGRSSPPSLTK